MRKFLKLVPLGLVVALFLASPFTALTQGGTQLARCKDLAYSTEEDFVTQGPVPPDGNPVISDGDLLSQTGSVCMRNAQLLQQFDVTVDLGLDAVDVLDVEKELVAFSTELNSPYGTFRHGDLLFTSGAVIPNQALLTLFQVSGDRGLDALHFVGDPQAILAFHELAKGISRDAWLREPGKLITELKRLKVNIWFSIEGTERVAAVVPIYDGDLLSVATGTLVAGNGILLPASVPAGLPSRGVDYGLDAVTATRSGNRSDIRFSTEILYRGKPPFTDGDILRFGNGVAIADSDLYKALEPKADFLGTDALYIRLEDQQVTLNFLPAVLKLFRNLLSPARGSAAGQDRLSGAHR